MCHIVFLSFNYSCLLCNSFACVSNLIPDFVLVYNSAYFHLFSNQINNDYILKLNTENYLILKGGNEIFHKSANFSATTSTTYKYSNYHVHKNIF